MWGKASHILPVISLAALANASCATVLDVDGETSIFDFSNLPNGNTLVEWVGTYEPDDKLDAEFVLESNAYCSTGYEVIDIGDPIGTHFYMFERTIRCNS